MVDASPPIVVFTGTPADQAIFTWDTLTGWLDITEGNLGTLQLIQNGTPYNMYDSSLVLMYNFDQNSIAYSPTNALTLDQSSFENGIWWRTYQIDGYGSATTTSTYSYIGSKSLQITRTSAGSEANVYQGIYLTPGKQYLYSAYVYATNPGDAAIYTYIGSGNIWKTNTITNQRQLLTGIITPAADWSIQLRLWQVSSILSSVYFDQVSLQEVMTQDVSQYANNGTINGAIRTGNGKRNGGYVFNGITSYVSVPTSTNLHPSSITAWWRVRFNTWETNWMLIDAWLWWNPGAYSI